MIFDWEQALWISFEYALTKEKRDVFFKCCDISRFQEKCIYILNKDSGENWEARWETDRDKSQFSYEKSYLKLVYDKNGYSGFVVRDPYLVNEVLKYAHYQNLNCRCSIDQCIIDDKSFLKKYCKYIIANESFHESIDYIPDYKKSTYKNVCCAYCKYNNCSNCKLIPKKLHPEINNDYICSKFYPNTKHYDLKG